MYIQKKSSKLSHHSPLTLGILCIFIIMMIFSLSLNLKRERGGGNGELSRSQVDVTQVNIVTQVIHTQILPDKYDIVNMTMILIKLAVMMMIINMTKYNQRPTIQTYQHLIGVTIASCACS